MADGRFVSKSISTDYELNCVVSLKADYLFEKCIPHLDRDGRMTGHPAEVKAKAVPLRIELSVEDVDRCLGELAAAKLVLWYEVDGKACLWFKGFKQHQRGLRYEREADSKVPSQHTPTAKQLTTVVRTNSEQIRQVPPEVNGMEWNNNHGAGSNVEKSIPEYAQAQEFTKFDLLVAAKRECGMGLWDSRMESKASSVVESWYGEGKTPGDIFGAIHGARILVDAGKVSWLAPHRPFGLHALRNTFTLADQGDGLSQRPLFDVALEEYVNDATGPPSRTANTGPGRVQVGDVLRAAVGAPQTKKPGDSRT